MALAEEESVRIRQEIGRVTVLDYILDGLEAELALERELGVRTVEFESDKSSVLGSPQQRRPAPAKPADPPRQEPPAPRPVQVVPDAPSQRPAPAAGGPLLDFVFIHDRPLSQGGAEMMEKIVKALGKTSETAPVVLERPFPKAKVYIVLGGLAMRKFFPDMKGAPGRWMKSKVGEDVLVTNSPEYILRFGEVTPAVRKMKEDMWRSLKAAMQRTRLYA